MKMKRKRKNSCPSPLLDDSPKRTKIHAQRKFAQGSNVNSPVITPIRELERDSPKSDLLPEPVELLPIKRPNTEDFLTFLCFRGTPILPPSLNFFNTASIVDTNGQVHEIKSESSPKNGPIDIAKCSSSSEKPFIAFGVRKRADPIVISRQMDRKRRHALALQALRRKYQEQKMAKIRALTISKLSEKVTNRTMVRTNTVSKTETVTKKTNTLQKTKVVATKHIKVTTRTLKTTMRPKMKIKQNMCLRSFRGRFKQQELPFRKKMALDKPLGISEKKVSLRGKVDEPLSTLKNNEPSTSNQSKPSKKNIIKNIVTTPAQIGPRFTRSSLTNTKSEIRRKQIKRILIPNPNTIIKTKPRSLRLTTMKKTVLSRRQNRHMKVKSKIGHTQNIVIGSSSKNEKTHEEKNTQHNNRDIRQIETRNIKQTINKSIESKETNKSRDIKKDYRKFIDLEVHKTSEGNRRHLTRSVDIKKEVRSSTGIKRKPNVTVAIKKTKVSNILHKKFNAPKNSGKKNEVSVEKEGLNVQENKRTTRIIDSKKNIEQRHSTGPLKKLRERYKNTIKSSVGKSPGTSDEEEINILGTAEDDQEVESIVSKTKNVRRTREKTVKNIEIKLSDSDDSAKDSYNSKRTRKYRNKQVKQTDEDPDSHIIRKTKRCGGKSEEKVEKEGNDSEDSHGLERNIPHIKTKNKNPVKQEKPQLLNNDDEEITSQKQELQEKAKNTNKIKRKQVPTKKIEQVEEYSGHEVSEKLLAKDINSSKSTRKDGTKFTKDSVDTENEYKRVANKTAIGSNENLKTTGIDEDSSDGDNTSITGKIVQETFTKIFNNRKTNKRIETIDSTSHNLTCGELLQVKGMQKATDENMMKNEEITKHTNINSSTEDKKYNFTCSQMKSEANDESEEIIIMNYSEKMEESGKQSLVTEQVDTDDENNEPLSKRAIKSRRDPRQSDSKELCKIKPTEKEDNPRNQRPSRKTKEAAAIYMELLSQKLVNDSRGDDDNISLDSFPELPNVKKMQQRENELKAKVKTSKNDKEVLSEKDEDQLRLTAIEALVELQESDKSIMSNKDIKEFEKSPNCSENVKNIEENSMSTRDKSTKDKILMENESVLDEGEMESSKNSKTAGKSSKISEDYESKHKPNKNDKVNDSKIVNKRKSLNENSEEDSKPKNKKSDISTKPDVAKVSEQSKPRRLTRQSLPPTRSDDNDSDESFHIDVKVPRKKKNTRSRVSVKGTKDTKQLNASSSDSDRSTTSDIALPPTIKGKNKKFSKTKSMKKCETNYSDSDDEPLSKLCKSVESNKKSSTKEGKAKDNLGTKESVTSLCQTKSGKKSPEPESSKVEPKPKRECAKLPQNYLPMFSSSDEDEIFHGFDEKTETKSKSFNVACSHAPPLLDLLNKDVGKRFGKERVNMSNEQIEKWLKDSALAGSSIKKENDEMLKFGERIPTETSLEISENIDTEKLKKSLLGETQNEIKEVKTESTNTTPTKTENISKTIDSPKPQLDRKLIFRKSKSENISTPNVNAFSPENESSVYAFGEENEDVISTPFRRPSRRPSSTATSKSEDESSKHDESSRSGHFRKPIIKPDTPKGITKDEAEPAVNTDIEDSKQFYVPQKPTKSTLLKVQNKSFFKSKSFDKLPDVDEFKYKIPSSPSASSSSSAKLYKRQTQKQKVKSMDFLTPIYASDFPKINEPSKLVEAPVFHPTEQEFQDPLEYIERIRHKAEQFGICRIVPPSSFKPECKVTDDMRFTAYNQYVNKMLYRWGPNFKELMAIKKYLETQSISLNHPPWIGGMEIDLPRLYQTVQTLGGLKEVIERKKWPKVSELMKIPKSAQDRVTKLDDIYCKYLLPYDTLSPAEREKLFDEVETEWAKKESRTLMTVQEKSNVTISNEADSEIDDNDSEECITKGRNMALNAFYRIARNTMSMYFKTNEPSSQEVEQEYWKHVTMRQNHICVNSGSIDCGTWGYGFPVSKNSPFGKHPWNLKVLTNNNASVLRSLGPLMGVTVPTLHVGMVFSACCWYRDPHGLPWIEYLHTGGTKIWYGIPNSMGELFHSSLKKLVPNYCKNKELWLPSDTIMVPPNLLVENQVSLCQTVQEPGQFVVVFPKAFTSSISTGYVVSESVYFAPIYWLKTARALFDELRHSNEPAMFSLDRLLMSVVNDGKCNVEIVRQTLPLIQDLCSGEMEKREKLGKLGKMVREKLPIPTVTKGKKKFQQGEEGDYECEICRSSLFLSMIFDTVEGITYCLDHAIEMIEKKELELVNCKFIFTYDDEELKQLPETVKSSLETKLQKKLPNKFAGMPTLLGRQN